VEIHTPSLAERVGDLPLLQNHLLRKFAKSYGKSIRGMTQRAQFTLQRHDSPGNVRELENVIGHACMMAVGETIDVEDLPLYLLLPTEGRESLAVKRTTAPEGPESLDGQEKRLLLEGLERTDGNQTLAARMLNVTRDRLRYRLKKYGIGTPHEPAGSE